MTLDIGSFVGGALAALVLTSIFIAAFPVPLADRICHCEKIGSAVYNATTSAFTNATI
jgi:hypothetical protein